MLRGYQNAVAGEVARFEGHVAKFMGDGVLAYLGWPVAHEDEAVRAGLAIVAEAAFRRALATAAQQKARLFELRAATALAGLWAERGERQRAHDLLAPLHGWFTGGHDLPDLVEAKALLDTLG